MKVIALDVDGVLLNFMPAFDQAASEFLKRPINVQKNEYQMDYYHLGKRVQASDEEGAQILQHMIRTKMYERLQALEGVKEALDAIKAEDFKIIIVTALPEEAREMRLKNLKDVLGLVPDEMYCVGMGMSKGDALKKINPDIFIDDRIDYLASASFIYHTAWVDQREEQKDQYSMVDVHVHSLKEWTEKHMPRIVKKLNRFYEEKNPIQCELKLENPDRKYEFNTNRFKMK